MWLTVIMSEPPPHIHVLITPVLHITLLADQSFYPSHIDTPLGPIRPKSVFHGYIGPTLE